MKLSYFWIIYRPLLAKVSILAFPETENHKFVGITLKYTIT